MTQQESKSANCDPVFGPAPSCHEVYTYWQSKVVPPVDVVSFDPDVHDHAIPWFEKNLSFEARQGYFYLLREGPKVDTAFALACTVSTGGPALYAAFALMTTLRQLEEWTPLMNTVCEHLDQFAPGVRQSWHPNAREVLPCMVEGDRTFRKDRDWHLRVDLAARVWSELSAQFQVVRQPHWT